MTQRAASFSVTALALAATVALWAGPDAAARGETFVLNSGGRVRGEWLNREESPREKFVIKSELGGVITLDRSQVEQVISESPEELEYEKIWPSCPDTVEGHVAIAQWCLERQLLAARRDHLERVIELDPNHEEARTALGYRRVGGEWMTRDEELASRGLKLYAGRYRTPQEIEIWEREKKQRLAEREWMAKLKRWHGWHGTAKADQAVASIRAIRDPFAVPALVKYLEDDEPRASKLLLIEVLVKIPSGQAVQALVERSLVDTDQEVRLSALDQIVAAKPPAALQIYINALKSKNNVEVNRAAVGLRALGNEEAVGPLIDALVTEHKFKLIKAPPGQMTTTFGRNGTPGGGISFGGNQPQIIKRNLTNKDVLSALVALTGVNFSYEVDHWKTWYAAQRRSQIGDARRD